MFLQFITALAALTVTAQPTLPQNNDWFTLGEITMFGQTDPDARTLPAQQVPIRFPQNAIPPMPEDAPYVQHGDWKIHLNEHGNPMRAFRGRGGWDEFKILYEEAQEKIAAGNTAKWKVKAVIFESTQVLYERHDGVLQPQRGFISTADRAFALETLARFKATVEAFTRGNVQVELTVSLEEEPVTGFYNHNETWSLHPFTAGNDYLRGRFNRGDFDSIIYFYHPGPTRAFSFGGTIGRTNNATQAYVMVSNGREQGPRIGHSEAMAHEWFHQVENTYTHFGYGALPFGSLPELHSAGANGYVPDSAGYSGWYSWLRDILYNSVRPGMWSFMTNRSDPDWSAVLRRTRPYDGGVYRWTAVRDDPWSRLPVLTPGDLAQRIGGTGMDIQSQGSLVMFMPQGVQTRTQVVSELDSGDYRFNNLLNFEREAMARIGYGDRDLIFIRFDAADFVLANLPSADVLGYMSVDTKMMVVADTRLDNDSTAELNVLRIEGLGMQVPGDLVAGSMFEVGLSGHDGTGAIVDWRGSAVRMEELGVSPGTHILRAIAVHEDGGRRERPFVIRVHEPVTIELEAVNTQMMARPNHQIRIHLSNNTGEARTVTSVAHAPDGWTVTQPAAVTLGAGQRASIELSVTGPGSAADGLYEIAVEAGGQTARVGLTRVTRADLAHDTFMGGNLGPWASPRPDRAGWLTEVQPGGVSGDHLVVTDRGGARFGRVSAYGRYLPNGERAADSMAYDLSAYPYLDFWLRTEFEDTLGLSITLVDGRRFVVMLGGPFQEQWGESVELPRARFVSNGQWQRIVYDLNAAVTRAAGPGPHFVSDIGFGDTRTFSSNHYQDTWNPASHHVDEFKITRQADIADNTTSEAEAGVVPADASSSRENHRARFAAQIKPDSPPEDIGAVRALLNDPSPFVRLNAAAAFTRVKDPEAAPVLADAAILERDPDAGIYMVRALVFQEAEETWPTISALFRQGRYEERALAEGALAMGAAGNPAFVQELMIHVASRSWLTRRDAVRALAMIDHETAARAMTIFLQETDPMVRLEVARGAKVDVDPVGRRIEWGSINDLSDIVRAYSYAALTRSAEPDLRRRGYDGLRQENPDIRIIIADELALDPQLHHVEPLRGLLSDPNPDVRAAALRSLLAMPGDRSFGEMTPLAGEEYEQVLLPLLAAAKAGRIEAPRAMLERLARHRSEEIRRMASELLS